MRLPGGGQLLHRCWAGLIHGEQRAHDPLRLRKRGPPAQIDKRCLDPVRRAYIAIKTLVPLRSRGGTQRARHACPQQQCEYRPCISRPWPGHCKCFQGPLHCTGCGTPGWEWDASDSGVGALQGRRARAAEDRGAIGPWRLHEDQRVGPQLRRPGRQRLPDVLLQHRLCAGGSSAGIMTQGVHADLTKHPEVAANLGTAGSVRSSRDAAGAHLIVSPDLGPSRLGKLAGVVLRRLPPTRLCSAAKHP